jgi:hypothetical protein
VKIKMRSVAVMVLAAITPALAGEPSQNGGEITDKNIRKIESQAKSAEDHLRIAQFYEAQAKLMQAKLAEAEDLVKYWGGNSTVVLNNNNKAPNPYWSAKNRAEYLRAEKEAAGKHAAEQQSLAESARQAIHVGSSFQ